MAAGAGYPEATATDCRSLRSGRSSTSATSGRRPCGHVRGLLDARLADIERQIAHLVALRDNIAALRDDASEPEPDTCTPD